MHRLRQNIERYNRLLRYVTDDRICDELEKLLQEAQEQLKDIDRRS